MAQEVVDTIATAMAAAVTDRAVSKFLVNFNQQMATDEKLQQMAMLDILPASYCICKEDEHVELDSGICQLILVPNVNWTYNTASGIFEPTLCRGGGEEKTLVFDISCRIIRCQHV